jgi:hypothetical protein
MSQATPKAANHTFQSANDAFYRAFAEADGGAMAALWAQSGPVFCCHPGWPPMVARAEIISSWLDIFSQGGLPNITFVPRQVAQIGDVGIVCGVEILGNGQFACTNIFVAEDGIWRMAHHHAGPLAPGTFANLAASVDPGRNVRH